MVLGSWDSSWNCSGKALNDSYFERLTMDKIYTVEEVSKILGISKVQVTIHLKNKGKAKVSGVYLITEEELEELKHRPKSGRPKKTK